MRNLLSVLIFGIVCLSTGFGQIVFKAEISGASENPPVTTTATGTGYFVLTANGTQLRYNITVNGLTMTAAHFHNAAVGVNGGVVKSLTFANNTASGVWSSGDASQPLTDSLLSELLRGRLYVNVHTSANAGGEIRGQVRLAGPVGFSAKLDGSQENPPVTTTASGTGLVTLLPDGSLTYDLTVTGLTPTASHFHNASAGTNGGVVKTVTLTNNSAAGTWSSTDASQPLTDALLRELVKGKLYLNAHTSANAGGEIRGQVLLNTGATFLAKLNGSQENPAISTTATGTGFFVLNGSGSQLSYRVTVNGLTMTGAHFHNAPAASNGGVVKSLTFANNSTSGIWSSTDASQPLTDSLLSELLRGRLYVNVHTAANAGGEIRGQVILTSAIMFEANLRGNQENPAVTTTASGTGVVGFSTTGAVEYLVTATGLTPTAAHFHNAPTGTNGGVVKGIALANNTTVGTWASGDATQPLTDLLLRELIKGRLYLNVHTAANAGGEIRGQVVGTSGVATGVERVQETMVPSSFILEQNYPNPFNPSTSISFSVAQAEKLSLRVFNVLGQVMATLVDDVKQPGVYRVTFDAGGLSSGTYFYRLLADGTIHTRKMTLIR